MKKVSDVTFPTGIRIVTAPMIDLFCSATPVAWPGVGHMEENSGCLASSVLFLWSIYLHLHHIKLFCCFVEQVPFSLFFFRKYFSICGPLLFHFRISLSMTMKTYVGISMGKTSNLEITSGEIDIFTLLIVPTHKRSMSSIPLYLDL